MLVELHLIAGGENWLNSLEEGGSAYFQIYQGEKSDYAKNLKHQDRYVAVSNFQPLKDFGDPQWNPCTTPY